MTNEQAIKMMEAKLKCIEKYTSGDYTECNNNMCDGCRLNYEQGNMGEQKEWLRMGIEALKNNK